MKLLSYTLSKFQLVLLFLALIAIYYALSAPVFNFRDVFNLLIVFLPLAIIAFFFFRAREAGDTIKGKQVRAALTPLVVESVSENACGIIGIVKKGALRKGFTAVLSQEEFLVKTVKSLRRVDAEQVSKYCPEYKDLALQSVNEGKELDYGRENELVCVLIEDGNKLAFDTLTLVTRTESGARQDFKGFLPAQIPTVNFH